jgi:hypothetical protein
LGLIWLRFSRKNIFGKNRPGRPTAETRKLKAEMGRAMDAIRAGLASNCIRRGARGITPGAGVVPRRGLIRFPGKREFRVSFKFPAGGNLGGMGGRAAGLDAFYCLHAPRE